MGISPKMNTVSVKTKAGELSFPFVRDVSGLSTGFLQAGGNDLEETLRFAVIKMLGDVIKFNSPMVVSNSFETDSITVKLVYSK